MAVALVASLGIASSALAFGGLLNGSFEEGTFTQTGAGYQNLVAGTSSATTIPDWTVTAGDVDWIDGFWTSQDEHRSVDLSGFHKGAISQTIATTIGGTYFVSFYLAGNPDDPQTPAVKSVTVSATGALAQTYTFDTTGKSDSSMGWTLTGYSFVASNANTTLTFASNTDGDAGPAIDNVVLTELAVPTGANCKNGGWATMFDASGMPFKNQGACVSYFATSGSTPIGPAAPAGSKMAALFDVTSSPSTTWTCALGASATTEGGSPTGATRGTVSWWTVGDIVSVTVSVVGGAANATYDVWVEQNPGTCPPGTSTPSNPGALNTNASGAGNATFTFTHVSGATNFWLSLWSPAGPPYPGQGGSVLRSTAVVLY